MPLKSYTLYTQGTQRFTEATGTGIITLESVIFSMRFCVYINKFIVSSSNNIFYIQIDHFTQKTMLNQTLYYKIRQFAALYLFIQHVQSFLLSNAKVRQLRTNSVIKKFIVSSNNNIFQIQIHHFTQQRILNQTLYYTVRQIAVLYLFIQHVVQSFLLSNAKVR